MDASAEADAKAWDMARAPECGKVMAAKMKHYWSPADIELFGTGEKTILHMWDNALGGADCAVADLDHNEVGAAWLCLVYPRGGMTLSRLWADFGLIEMMGLANRIEGLANRSEGLGAGPCR